MPGYTHLQRAQPVYLGHHLLAYVWMFLRDRVRFDAVTQACAVLPLGAGALAGVNFPTDRALVAAQLGFETVAMIRMRVDLPAPFGPSKPVMPGSSRRVSGCKACTSR